MQATSKAHTKLSAEHQQIAAAKQDVRAFGVLYERYYEPIFLFIYKRTTEEALCADLCSKVFLKAMNNLHRYEDRGFPFSSWLYRIAINEVNQHFRKNKHAIRHVSLNAEIATHWIGDVSDDSLKEARLAALKNALADLKEAELALIELRFFDQCAFAEMAEILGVSEASVKMKTYRILDKLKQKLSKVS